MTPEKIERLRLQIEELKLRMLHHEVENDTAIVKLTAKELYELIELAEKALRDQ